MTKHHVPGSTAQKPEAILRGRTAIAANSDTPDAR
jgi:hypothetical protein